MTTTTLRRAWIGIALVAIALAGGIAGYAYWTTNGSGSGTASAGTTTDNLVISSVPVTGITPGSSTPVTVTVSNPNSYSVHVGTVSTAITTSDPTCLAGDFSFPAKVLDTTVAALGSTSFTQNLVFADTGVSQDACKGASVTLTYSSD